jgi:hypothetical protein
MRRWSRGKRGWRSKESAIAIARERERERERERKREGKPLRRLRGYQAQPQIVTSVGKAKKSTK